MQATTKEQVTIPQNICKTLFTSEKDSVISEINNGIATKRFAKLRGITTVPISTEEIMALTRKDVHLITP